MRHRLIHMPFLLVSLALVSPIRAQPPEAGPATVQANGEVRSELEAALRAALAQYPGVAFSVRGPGGATWQGAAGVADVETHTPFMPTTRIAAYSVNKPMTAALALRLAEHGRLSLDAPIGAMAGVPPAFAALTPRQLMSHTAGIRHYRDGEWMRVSRAPCVTSTEALAPFREDPLQPPGTFGYSSFGYVLLSHVIETAAGTPFSALMTESVFRPAGIDGASLWAPGRRRPPSGHEGSGGSFRAALAIDNSCKFGAGALVASADDLARFGVALATGRIVAAASWQMMIRPVTPGYGLGLGLSTLSDGRPVAVHSGSAIGGTSAIVIDIQTGTTAAAVGNAEGPSLLDRTKGLLELALRSSEFRTQPNSR